MAQMAAIITTSIWKGGSELEDIHLKASKPYAAYTYISRMSIKSSLFGGPCCTIAPSTSTAPPKKNREFDNPKP